MGLRELKERYGVSLRTSQAFNRAIRTEIVGGKDLMEALKYANNRQDLGELGECLRRIRAEMANEVARRYGLQSATKGENDERRSN
ncbi:MAG: hypothetical protein IJY15_14090 [Thermoguttaceae bacterium]|nr:hypothetical protein [Thermoguttaceae bacterium]